VTTISVTSVGCGTSCAAAGSAMASELSANADAHVGFSKYFDRNFMDDPLTLVFFVSGGPRFAIDEVFSNESTML
jgi:hypothetical protein